MRSLVLAVLLGACASATAPGEPSINPELFARYYPAGALERGISGSATVDCFVKEDGLLDCVAIEETPAGMGFGEALVAVSRHFRVRPEDGIAPGERIRRTTTFVPPR